LRAVDELSPEEQERVIDYIEDLIRQRASK